MQRLDKIKKNEIWVILERHEITRYKKNWPNFTMPARKLIFKYEVNTFKLKEKNFYDYEVGDLNATIALCEFAKRIAKC